MLDTFMDTQIILLLLVVVLLTASIFMFDVESGNKIKQTKNKVIEKYQNNHEDTEVENTGESEDTDESEDTSDDSEDDDFDDDDIHHSSEATTNDPIIIHDTIRRDSKVDSSLEYTYIDEQCQRIHTTPTFPTENIESNESAPLTPVVKYTNSKDSTKKTHCPKNKLEEEIESRHEKEIAKINNSEMFDDSELKPKPDVDSPYGFVYFPNKYWKQWHQKAPVCIPTSKCKVLPTYTQGTPVDVLDYTQIGSMMPRFSYSEEIDYK